MKLRLVIAFAIWSQALPAVAYAGSRFRTKPGAALVLGSLVSVLANVVGFILAALLHNNQIVSYISSPLTAALWFAALAEWQLTPRERIWLRRLIIAFLIIWIALVTWVEDVSGFDVVTAPFYSFSIMSAAVWTLLRRATAELHAPFYTADWFWVCVALAINGAVTGLAAPIGGYLYAKGEIDTFRLVWDLRAGFVTLSMVLLSWGVFVGPGVSKFFTIGTTEA